MANYKATITGNGLAESKEKHTPSVHLQLKATFNLDTHTICEKMFYADLWLSEKAKKNTVDTLRAIGYEGNTLSELNTPCLVGYEVEISTYSETYNGQAREKVNFVNAVGSYERRGIKALDDGLARNLASRYDALFRNTKPTNKPVISQEAPKAQQGNAYAPKQTETQGNAEDDLPFNGDRT